jgi:hypothetical protein
MMNMYNLIEILMDRDHAQMEGIILNEKSCVEDGT